MNLLDAVVTKVLDTPKYYRFEAVEWWQVTVEYNCYGRLSIMCISKKTREEIELVQEGYRYQC